MSNFEHAKAFSQRTCKLLELNEPQSNSIPQEIELNSLEIDKRIQRFQGQNLPKSPKVALIVNDAIGNFVIASSVSQQIIKNWAPSEFVVFTGDRVSQFNVPGSLYKQFVNFLRLPRDIYLQVIEPWRSKFDIVINIENSEIAKGTSASIISDNGYVIGNCKNANGIGDLQFQEDWQGKLGADPNWISESILTCYPYLNSSFIGDIFSAQCYFEDTVLGYNLPSEEVAVAIPDILISASASLDSKLWPFDRWLEIIRYIESKKLTAGLLGAPRNLSSKFWSGNEIEDGLIKSSNLIDLRGKFTLPQVIGAFSKCRFGLCIDNGLLHLACAAGVPAIGLYREGINRLWCPPFGKIVDLVPDSSKPVSSIKVEKVRDAVDELVRN